jgi:hypothetical protein
MLCVGRLGVIVPDVTYMFPVSLIIKRHVLLCVAFSSSNNSFAAEYPARLKLTTVLVYRQNDTARSETVSVSFRFRIRFVLSFCFSEQKNTFLSVVDIYNEFNTLVFCLCFSICTILS